MAYSGSHQYKEAEAVFKMAIRIKREVVDAGAYYLLGNAYVALNKNGEAVEAFKQALYITRAQSADPDASPHHVPSPREIHYSLGIVHYNMKRYNDAIKELKEAIKLDPKFAEAYYALALGYVAINDRMSAQKQEEIVRPLNTALADKINEAISARPKIPIGCQSAYCQTP